MPKIPKAKRIGDNGEPVLATPDQIAECLAAFTDLKSEAKIVSNRITALLAAHEGHGGSPGNIKELWRIGKLDPDVARAKEAERTRYLATVGIHAWTTAVQQASFDLIAEAVSAKDHDGGILPDMTPNPAARARVEAARAHADGYNSGFAGGGPEDNPHPVGTEEQVRWLKGCGEGRDDRRIAHGDEGAPTRREKGRKTATALDLMPLADAEVTALGDGSFGTVDHGGHVIKKTRRGRPPRHAH